MGKTDLERLDLLPDAADGSLYTQREAEYSRTSFRKEVRMLRFIMDGRPEGLKTFMEERQSLPAGPGVVIGKMSKNALRQLKYSAVAGIALACRAAIMGGLPESVAYSFSDELIMAVDESHAMEQVTAILRGAFFDYARLVKEARYEKCAPAVAGAVDYILTHSHQNISLADLAAGANYSPEYLARLFKKQVGVSVSRFILATRMEEAKDLLRQGRTCRDVAYTMGFASQSYFIRQFKAYTGRTPHQFALGK